jgi:hypothetical protein
VIEMVSLCVWLSVIATVGSSFLTPVASAHV